MGAHVAGDGEERAARQPHLQQAEADFAVLLPFEALWPYLSEAAGEGTSG